MRVELDTWFGKSPVVFNESINDPTAAMFYHRL